MEIRHLVLRSHKVKLQAKPLTVPSSTVYIFTFLNNWNALVFLIISIVECFPASLSPGQMMHVILRSLQFKTAFPLLPAAKLNSDCPCPVNHPRARKKGYDLSIAEVPNQQQVPQKWVMNIYISRYRFILIKISIVFYKQV